MLKWPEAAFLRRAAKRWAEEIGQRHPEVLRVGCFGSYARGSPGVGSDLDLVVIVEHAAEPFPLRAAGFDATRLPVPADVLVYTQAEWDALCRRSGFGITLHRETVWLYSRAAPGADQRI